MPGRKGLMPLTYAGLMNKLRAVLESAGYNPSLYSSHSFQRRSASYAFASGVSPLLIQLQGDWVSDSYKRYLEFDVGQRAVVARMVHLFC